MAEKDLKPGYKTSEFWLVVAFAAVVVANSTFNLGISEQDLLLLASLTGIQGMGRHFIKSKG